MPVVSRKFAALAISTLLWPECSASALKLPASRFTSASTAGPLSFCVIAMCRRMFS